MPLRSAKTLPPRPPARRTSPYLPFQSPPKLVCVSLSDRIGVPTAQAGASVMDERPVGRPALWSTGRAHRPRGENLQMFGSWVRGYFVADTWETPTPEVLAGAMTGAKS